MLIRLEVIIISSFLEVTKTRSVSCSPQLSITFLVTHSISTGLEYLLSDADYPLGWTSADADMTLSRDTSVKKDGSGSLKVAVASPPEKGAANKALIKLLAQYLNLRPAQIQILTGQTQPRKQILILDLNAQQLRTRLP